MNRHRDKQVETVAQAFEPAVSQVFQPANRPYAPERHILHTLCPAWVGRVSPLRAEVCCGRRGLANGAQRTDAPYLDRWFLVIQTLQPVPASCRLESRRYGRWENLRYRSSRQCAPKKGTISWQKRW